MRSATRPHLGNRLLPVGPRSVLWGVHQFLIHPLLLAVAWTRLYGFPRDSRLWVAFFVHDLGYLFQWCRDLDGEEGERHVEWGAGLMRRLFGDEWGDLCLYHSRFYAAQHGVPPSRLSLADKAVIAFEPAWLYLPRALLSGEVWEYVSDRLDPAGKYAVDGDGAELRAVWARDDLSTLAKLRFWHAQMTRACQTWVETQTRPECSQEDAMTRTDARSPGGDPLWERAEAHP